MLDSYVKRALQAVKVSEIPEITRWRVGNPTGDGGYVVAKELIVSPDTQQADLYSFGIGDESSFEQDMSSYFRSIMMFDKYPCEIKKKNPNMFFSPLPFSTGILKNFRIPFGSMLKFDVEGAEWDILEYGLNNGVFDNFSQIVGEFHMFPVSCVGQVHSPYFSGVYTDFYRAVNEKLFHQYYRVLSMLHTEFFCIHVHANNSLPYSEANGFCFPPLLELSFVRKSCVRPKYSPKYVSFSQRYFPIMNLDVPNKADRPDFRDVYPLYKEGEIC